MPPPYVKTDQYELSGLYDKRRSDEDFGQPEQTAVDGGSCCSTNDVLCLAVETSSDGGGGYLCNPWNKGSGEYCGVCAWSHEWETFCRHEGEKSAELAAEDAAKSSTDSKAEAEVALRLRYADTLAQGFSATVYKDSDGFLTAGWGHRLTEEEAMKYEEGDVVDEETLNRWEDEEELDEDEVEFDAAEFDFDAEDWDEVGEGGEGENEDNDEGEDEDEDEDAQAREAADDSGLPKQLEAEESFLDQDVTQFDKEFADYLSQGAARMATAPDPPLAQEPPQFVDISRDVEGDRSTPSNSPGSRDTKGAPSIVDSSGRKRLGTVTGVCTRWLNVRGYGFVETEDGNTDVFVHQSSIISEGFRSLQVGEKVELELIEENGKMVGMDVKSRGARGSDPSAGGWGKGKGMSNGKGKGPWDESGYRGNSKGYKSSPDDYLGKGWYGGKGASSDWGGRGRPQNYLVQDADYVWMSGEEEEDLGPGDSMPMQKRGVGNAGKVAVDYGGRGTIGSNEDVWDAGNGRYADFGKGGKGYDSGKGMGKGGKGGYGGKGGFDNFGQGKEKGGNGMFGKGNGVVDFGKGKGEFLGDGFDDFGNNKGGKGKGGFEDYGKGKGKGFGNFVKGKGGFDDSLGIDFDDFGKGKGGFDNYGKGKGKGFDDFGKGRGGFDDFGKGKGVFDDFGKGKGGFDNFGRGKGKGFDDFGKGRGGFDEFGKGRDGFDDFGKGKSGFDNFGKGKGRGFDGVGQGKGGFDDFGKGKGDFDDFGKGKGGFDDFGTVKGGFDESGQGKGKGFEDFGRGNGGFNDFGKGGFKGGAKGDFDGGF